MKRIFTFLMALTLTVTSCCSYFSSNVYASGSNQSSEAEATTSVDLLNSEKEETTEQEATKDLPDTGIAYDLTGMSGSPDITAESAIVMDARSGEILYSKKADAKRYPASITKIMTTLLAIENCKMDDMVDFTESAVYGIEEGSSTAGINAGAKLTVEQTLYALMLVSANEAGAAIAEHISGSNEEFGKLMTKRAKELGCTGTHFTNPHGLPDEEHYTTAHDMGLIMKECIKHEEFRKIAGTISYTLESDTLTAPIELWNHAKILRDNTEYYYKYCKGAKTGYTMAANNTLVTYAKKGDTMLLCVILKDYGADQSYYDTIHLYKWGFDQVKTLTPLKDFDLDSAIEATDGLTKDQIATYQSLNGTWNEDYPILVKKDFDESSFKEEFRLDEDTTTGRLGYVDVKAGDDVIYTTEITYDTTSDAAKTYLTEKDEGDDLKAAKPVNKNSLLSKMIKYLIRIVIACALIYIIMQLIRRRELEKKRQNRIKNRQNKNKASGYNSSNKSTNSGNGSAKKNTSTRKPSEGFSKGSGNSSSGEIKRNRRHK